MKKEDYVVVSKLIIIVAMVLSAVIGCIILSDIDILSLLNSNTNISVKIKNDDFDALNTLISFFIALSIMIYAVLFFAIMLSVASCFLEKRDGFDNLKNFIPILYSGILLIGIVLILYLQCALPNIIAKVISNVTSQTGNTIANGIVALIITPIINTIQSFMVSILCYALFPSVLGLIIHFNAYNKCSIEDNSENNNDSAERMEQKILTKKINEAKEKLITKELETEYENIMKKMKEHESGK